MKKNLMLCALLLSVLLSGCVADPAACIPNEDKHDSSPSFSSEPVSAPTESNVPTPEEDRQAPVIPEKPEKIESPKEEPSVPAIIEPEPTSEPEPTFDIEHWISYAKSTAVSLGLTLDRSATDGKHQQINTPK